MKITQQFETSDGRVYDDFAQALNAEREAMGLPTIEDYIESRGLTDRGATRARNLIIDYEHFVFLFGTAERPDFLTKEIAKAKQDEDTTE